MEHSPASVERVQEIIRTASVEFINLQFTDIMGIVKTVGIPVGAWPDVLKHGMWFDGSSIQGFARIAESDMLLHPDLDTFAVIPWDTDAPTARVICNVFTPNGEPFEGDPRNVLKRALAVAEEMGYQYYTGPELEFFLLKPQPDGSLYPLTPARPGRLLRCQHRPGASHPTPDGHRTAKLWHHRRSVASRSGCWAA